MYILYYLHYIKKKIDINFFEGLVLKLCLQLKKGNHRLHRSSQQVPLHVVKTLKQRHAVASAMSANLYEDITLYIKETIL